MLQKYVYMYVHVCIQRFQNVEKLYRVESFETLCCGGGGHLETLFVVTNLLQLHH